MSKGVSTRKTDVQRVASAIIEHFGAYPTRLDLHNIWSDALHSRARTGWEYTVIEFTILNSGDYFFNCVNRRIKYLANKARRRLK